MAGLLTVLHLTVCLIYYYAFYFDTYYVVDRNPHYLTFATRWKFLTIWNLCFQAVFYTITLLNDLFGSNVPLSGDQTKRSSLQKLRDWFLSTIAWPIGAFVVIAFWGIYAVDRELVYPEYLDKIIPSWLNHVMHTTVIPFLLLDKFLVYHHYPTRSKGLMSTLGIAVIYQAWLLFIAFHADIWVYPVLEVLNWPMRIVFFITCWIVFIILYIIGEKVTKMFWGEPEKEKKRA